MLLVAGCVSITSGGMGQSIGSPGVPGGSGSASQGGSGDPPMAAGSPGAVPSGAPGSARPSPDPSIIGYIALDDDVPYVRSVSAGIRAEAELAGLQLVACDSGWSRQGALGCAEELGSAGVGGVISFQPFGDATSTICDALGDVPTLGVVFDQGPCMVSMLGIDQARSGRLAGAAVGRFAEERWGCQVGAFVSLTSTSADADASARMQGYRDGFAEVCPLPEATLSLERADRVATARAAVARVLSSLEGDRIVVVGLNEDAILGAMSAAGAAARATDLWYSGQLADPSIRRHIACDDQYIASVAQFPGRFGSQVVPVLIEAMEGRPVPERLDAHLELVSRENVRGLFPDTPACDA